MINNKFYLTLLMCGLTLAGCKSNETVQAATDTSVSTHNVQSHDTNLTQSLKVATWNVEHLAFPYTDGCRPRTEQEIAQLKGYAKSIDADIVALQEVASKQAVAQLFPADNWQVLMSDRPDNEAYECRKTGFMSTQQKVAFAVKKGLAVESLTSLKALGLDNPGLRYGVELVVNSSLGKFKLLNVHMKSGCFVDNYKRSDNDSCMTYAKQAEVLVDWVQEQDKASVPYIILGDFNHRLSAPYNAMTQKLANATTHYAALENTTQALIGCHPYYPAPIDHILVGKLSSNYQKDVKAHLFSDMEPKAMLSDHCAVSLELTNNSLPLSNGVTWQTTSAEYRYLAELAYKNATKALKAMTKPDGDWVVVMDVDETILDNSPYNAGIEKVGKTYERKTWNQWVASEKAALVPGAKMFIEAVLENGGKFALVTNRERALDHHTWKNLQQMEIPVSIENTCLMGRTKADKLEMGKNGVINDKDLRRAQVVNGEASCFASKGKRHNGFPKATILMQVGDNIEDFAGVLQHDANIEQLLKKNGLVLLPNAMYGSW